MATSMNICPKNFVDGFCNVPIDFCRERVWGMMCLFTSILIYGKVLLYNRVSCA